MAARQRRMIWRYPELASVPEQVRAYFIQRAQRQLRWWQAVAAVFFPYAATFTALYLFLSVFVFRPAPPPAVTDAIGWHEVFPYLGLGAVIAAGCGSVFIAHWLERRWIRAALAQEIAAAELRSQTEHD